MNVQWLKEIRIGGKLATPNVPAARSTLLGMSEGVEGNFGERLEGDTKMLVLAGRYEDRTESLTDCRLGWLLAHAA